MKKICLFLAVLLAILPLASCGEKARYDYDLAPYVDLGEYDPVRAVFDDPSVCTEEMIDSAVFQVCLSYATYSEKEGAAAQYDRVDLTYSILHEGEEVDKQDSYTIVIGSDYYSDVDRALGEALIGAGVGEVRSVTHTFPENDTSLGTWAGMTVTVQGQILKLYQNTIPECTDDFVKQIDGYSFGDVAEFRQAVKEEILVSLADAKKEAVWAAFMEQIKVTEYPEEEVEKYEAIYRQDLQDAADAVGLSFSEYLEKHVMMDADTVEEKIREDARRQVKEDLATVQYSRLIKTQLSQEEYDRDARLLYESEGAADSGFSTFEEFEAHWGKEELRRILLWEKSFEIMVDRAVRIEE